MSFFVCDTEEHYKKIEVSVFLRRVHAQKLNVSATVLKLSLNQWTHNIAVFCPLRTYSAN